MSEAHQEQPFKVHKFVCYAGRAIQQKRRHDAEEAKKAEKPEGWNDGQYYVAEPFDPEEGKRD